MKLCADARRLLDAPNFGHLATLMADGAPKVEPVWVAREGDLVLVATDRRTLKARNMERDPRVAISITDHEDPYQTAQLRGAVIEVRGAEAAHDIADWLALKYTGEKFPFRPPTSRGYVVRVDKVRSTQLGFEHRPSAA